MSRHRDLFSFSGLSMPLMLLVNHRRHLWLGLALLLVLAGCGRASYPLAPVSGRVTLDGAPLAGANLGFEPRAAADTAYAGWGSYAKTDADGRFVLSTVDGTPGAVVGPHDVWIREPLGSPQLPARYHFETILSFDVPAAGSDRANFDLTSD